MCKIMWVWNELNKSHKLHSIWVVHVTRWAFKIVDYSPWYTSLFPSDLSIHPFWAVCLPFHSFFFADSFGVITLGLSYQNSFHNQPNDNIYLAGSRRSVENPWRNDADDDSLLNPTLGNKLHMYRIVCTQRRVDAIASEYHQRQIAMTKGINAITGNNIHSVCIFPFTFLLALYASGFSFHLDSFFAPWRFRNCMQTYSERVESKFSRSLSCRTLNRGSYQPKRTLVLTLMFVHVQARAVAKMNAIERDGEREKGSMEFEEYAFSLRSVHGLSEMCI